MARKASPKTSAPVVTTVPMTKARNNLSALVERVRLNKEYFILEKDGIPIAGIMDIDVFEDYLELQDPKVRAMIAKGRQEYLAGKSRPAEGLLQELQNRKGGKVTWRHHP
jgi:antitoxin (DNA-binding transcriptional repressor) of toxin-antitoxin stability system